MKERKEPAFVKGTLKWCNKKRKEKGLEPMDRLPRGKPMDGNSCPCGKATGLYVGAHGFAETLGEYEEHSEFNGLPMKMRTPQSVQEFVAEFDCGRLPQYEEKS